MKLLSLSYISSKLAKLNGWVVLLLVIIASVGFVMLYSAADARFSPWASKQIIRFSAGVVVMILVACTDIRTWFRHSYILYGVSLILLFLVELAGFVGMGARRWVDLYVFQLQPSELMKIALILALARYFHRVIPKDMRQLKTLVPPLVMVLLPTLLVMRQPDLGTALILLMVGAGMFWVAGLPLKYALSAIGATLTAMPVLWGLLRDYQKNRVLTFLDPERDPSGAGYHILQSKIAIGSGGFWGKGFMKGPQSHLEFLPEPHTDFIFTMIGEELGFLGGMFVMILYSLLLAYGYRVSLSARSQFGRLVSQGISTTLFLYVFINIAMVMGLVPVVGVPLPLISYGGTAMLTLLIGIGLLMSTAVHKDVRISSMGSKD